MSKCRIISMEEYQTLVRRHGTNLLCVMVSMDSYIMHQSQTLREALLRTMGNQVQQELFEKGHRPEFLAPQWIAFDDDTRQVVVLSTGRARFTDPPPDDFATSLSIAFDSCSRRPLSLDLEVSQ